MKTDLEILIKGAGLNAEKTMNALQGAGMVSDNAVTAGEVANADAQAAWSFLKELGEALRAKFPG